MSSGGGGSHTAIQKEQGQVMPGSDAMPHEVDLSQPSVARIYDYYLGGKDNYPVGPLPSKVRCVARDTARSRNPEAPPWPPAPH